MGAARAREASERACAACGKAGAARVCEACGAPRWAGRWAVARAIAHEAPVRTLEAIDEEGRRALVFELVPDDATDGVVESFEQLSERLRRIVHPGLPPWLDGFVLDDAGRRLYAVQAWSGARNLAEFPRTPLPWRRALALGRGLLDALAALHGGLPRLVHGDVRPTRVLVDEDDAPSLTGSGVLEALAREGPEKALWEARDPSRDLRGAGAVLFRLADRFGRTPDEVADVAAALVDSGWDAGAKTLVARLLELPGSAPFRRATEAREALAALLEKPPAPTRARRIAESVLATLLALRRGTKWLRYAGLVLLGLTPGYLAGAGLLPWGKPAPHAERRAPKHAPEKPSGPENPWEAGGLRALAGGPDGAVVAVAFASPGCDACAAAIATLERIAGEKPGTPRVVKLVAFDPAVPEQLAWARTYRGDGASDLRLSREARMGGGRALTEPLVYVDGTRAAADEASLSAALDAAQKRVRR